MRRKSPEEQTLRDKQKMLERVWEELGESDCVLLVEGKRDKASLLKAGVKFPIVFANRPLPKVVAQAEEFELAALLMDFDAAGEDLLRRVKESLEAANIRCDVDARRRLRYVLGVRCFEEYQSRLRQFQEKIEQFER